MLILAFEVIIVPRVSKFVELSVEMSVAFFSTLNATLISTINDTEFFEKILFHLNYYFF